MSTPADTVRRLLVEEGGALTGEVYDQVVALKDAAIGPLVEVLLDDTLLERTRSADDETQTWAPMHAAYLLGELTATAAIPALLKRIDPTRVGAELSDAVVDALQLLGAAAVEPALQAFGASRTPEERWALADVLAIAGEEDERIWKALLEVLREDPVHGASLLVLYEDPRTLEVLSRTLDALPEEQPDPLGEHASCALGQAIEDLGGKLTPAQEEKLARLHPDGDASHAFDLDELDFVDAVEPQEPVHAPERPGRNDPCWCGSGQKYKKCHLSQDRASPPEAGETGQASRRPSS